MTVRITITADVEPAFGQSDEELLAWLQNDPPRVGSNRGPAGLLAYFPMSFTWMSEHGDPKIKTTHRILPPK